jgi:fumarate reductase flavoprotein subunit
MAEDYEVDAVIVGGGACGMMAALRAADRGAKSVAIFEKSTKQGSNSEYSSGSLVAGGTRWQREAGIVDTPARHAEDILAVSGDLDAKDVVYAVCEAPPRYVEWLADELGYPIELGVEMERAGQSVPRIHRDRDRIGGPYLVGALRRAIERSDVIGFVDNTPVVGLLESDGTVEGARIAAGGEVSIARAGSTVLAADGFAANREMLARYCPGAEELPYGGVSTSSGDAIEWGLSLGAAVRNMGCLLGHGLMVVGTGTRLDAVLPQVGAVLVNSSGDRFVEERECGYSKLSTRILKQPGRRAALIWDETAMLIAKESKPMRESTAARAYMQYPDLSGLAQGIGLPTGKLKTALEESNSPARRHLQPPFYVGWVTGGVLATQGGLDIDPWGRVRKRNGDVVPGLFAGGGSAAGISGASADGYSSGNGLLSALGLGWIIGEQVGGSRAKP